MKRFFPLLFLAFSLFLAEASVLSAAEPASEVYAASEVDLQPELRKKFRIKFPTSLKKKGVVGDIVIRYVVTAKGEVANLVVVRFADPDMVQPVYEAYAAATYRPGMKNGQPVATRMEVTISYPTN